jgi:NAD(P)-dependent dehydrogenase (short-subunit alcohol dehydrogenase family)
MRRNIQSSVVVITGASSGIGRATALAFARRGASVVVAARRDHALQEVVAECEREGGRALAVPTDVSNERAVQELASRAIEHFGRIDIWVNNAAVLLFAPFEEAPLEDYRRVIDVDLWGYIYGARAALPIFHEQGSGVLINNASMVATLSQPYASAYVLSKHAIWGLSKSLRQELALARAKDIHVCTIMPAEIDTPFFHQAANYTGRAAKAMPPVYTPERVAESIVSLAERPRRQMFVGNSARILNLQYLLAPGLTERILALMVDRLHFYQDKAAEPNPGNLWEPMPQHTEARGGWQSGSAERMRSVATGGMAALIPALLTWRWYQQRQAASRGLLARLATRVTG